eukprot:2543555-Prymnesium_polylepis.1
MAVRKRVADVYQPNLRIPDLPAIDEVARMLEDATVTSGALSCTTRQSPNPSEGSRQRRSTSLRTTSTTADGMRMES